MPQPCKYHCREDERPKCNDPSCVQYYVNRGTDVRKDEPRVMTEEERAARRAERSPAANEVYDQIVASLKAGDDHWKEEI